MVLISEVKESGDVEAQLWHILEKEEYQTHTAHTTQESRGRRAIDKAQLIQGVSQLNFRVFHYFFSVYSFLTIRAYFLDKPLNLHVFKKKKKKRSRLLDAYFNK